MPRTALLILLACLAAAPARAQQSPLPPKPYAPLPIAFVPALGDAGFEAFRHDLAAVAKGRIYAELARLVVVQGFFWDRDFDGRFDPRRPAVDNLGAALRLEHDGGLGWRRLAEFAAEATAEPQPARPGIVCAPARPRYDAAAFARLLDDTYTGGKDWVFPRADGIAVRSAARPDATETVRLGLHFIRLLGFERSAGRAPAKRGPWAQVAMPTGSVGFVAPGRLRALTDEQLCYGKDRVGRWRIAGFIAREN